MFDRSRSGEELTGAEENVTVRVFELGPRERVEFDLFLDVSSLEAFIDGGRHAMTGNVYPDPERATGVRFFAEGGRAAFADIQKYDIDC